MAAAPSASVPSVLLLLLLLVLLASPSLRHASAQPSTFGLGIPNFPVTASEERLIFNHTLSPSSAMGVLGHFWSTACGGRSIDWEAEGGIAIYRVYVDGEASPSLTFTPRTLVGLGFAPAASATPGGPSLAEPWSTELFGKLSDWDGFYSKFRIPFYASVSITVQLPPGVADFNVYTIVRGHETDERGFPQLTVPGYGPLPLGTRLRLLTNDRLAVPNLGFIPIVNLTEGTGLVYSYMVATMGHPQFFYLEGCFHLLTPFALPVNASNGVAANFPGVVLSTGTEDMYSSSFYGHAGLFAARDSGFTHMCGEMAPHPACRNATQGFSEWSAYKVHDQAGDLLLFSGGAQLLLRNGDKADPTPYGTAKCYNLDTTPDGMSPGPSVVSTAAWVYLFPDGKEEGEEEAAG